MKVKSGLTDLRNKNGYKYNFYTIMTNKNAYKYVDVDYMCKNKTKR